MKRLLAALALACAVGWVTPASADYREGLWYWGTPNWRTSAAAYTGVSRDSVFFSADGSAAANRDTSAWIPADDMIPYSTGLVPTADSSVAFAFVLKPHAESSLSPGADSCYFYLEGSYDGVSPSIRLATNLTEILTLEANSDNTFAFKVTWARWAQQMQGCPFVRVIARGDLNGAWSARYGFPTAASNKAR